MRFFIFALSVFATPVLADSFTLSSPVTAVTVYPEGGKITRTVPFTVPAGAHSLVLPDLPTSVPLQDVRVSVEGAQMGAMTMRDNYVPPRDAQDPQVLLDAQAEVLALEQQIEATENRASAARLAQRAADAQLQFLSQIGGSDGLVLGDVNAVRELSDLVRDQAFVAHRTALEANIQAREIERTIEDQQDALADARQRVESLELEDTERAYLSVAINAPEDATGVLTVSYFTFDAYWQPVYDMYLTRGATPSIDIERGAFVRQDTGETWTDVALELSTVEPSNKSAPSELFPTRRRIADPAPVRQRTQDGNFGSLAAPVMESPVIVEAAVTDLSGYSVVYVYPSPVTIATDADAVRLKLDTLTTGAEIEARAVPRRDDTAFLMAKITNDTNEEILPTGFVSLYVDDTYVGDTETAGIPSGAQEDLPFGPIDGLRLRRTVLAQSEGDRGILTVSNERTHTARIEIENLTNDTWPVRLFDQVPYTEQEDLEITWSATPAPTDENVDNKRGILGWNLLLPPSAREVIELTHTMTWPDGKVLR
ncbi:MAG: mucoidy inhibitor MuiA family protein [Sedimentitalea sp.]